MKLSYRSKMALLGGLLCAVPLVVAFWMLVKRDSSYLKLQRDAETIIILFHQRYNTSDFDAICGDALGCKGPPDLADNWRKRLEQARREYGAFKAVRESHVKVYVEPATVQVSMDSSFDKALLNERFLMRKVEGKLRLVLYAASEKHTASLLLQGRPRRLVMVVAAGESSCSGRVVKDSSVTRCQISLPERSFQW